MLRKAIFNYYNGSNKNFVGPILNVAGRALSVNGISVTPAIPGIVDSNGILQSARFVANFNYGEVKSYGIDAGLNYQFSKIVNLALKYSWFNSDITKGRPDNDANKDGVVSVTEKSLNTPKNRGVAIVSLQNLCKEKLYINFSARYIQQYDFYSGNQNGTKDGKGKWGVNLTVDHWEASQVLILMQGFKSAKKYQWAWALLIYLTHNNSKWWDLHLLDG